MENKLEQLLNSLIEKGWKPSGKECSHFIMQNDVKVLDWKVIYTAVRKDEGVYNIHYTLRELVSKESGLWQFVCKNGMVKNVDDYSWELYDGTHGQCDVYKNGYEGGTRWEQVDYEYRLIESALKDEGELEDFLLSNIKADE